MYCEPKRWQFRFRKAEIASAHLFATRRFSPDCFPLPVRGIGRSLCKTMIYSRFSSFCAGQATKKEPRMKAPKVRIKGLEPPRRKASDPKSDVATNYTISASFPHGVRRAHPRG